MIRKSLSPSPLTPQSRIRVTFELPSCTWACRITVCGDFNNWDQHALPMRQDRDGVWRAVVDLAPNRRYSFRYLIDGNWQTDYHADGWSMSGFNSENSIIDTGVLPELSPEELALLADPAARVESSPATLTAMSEPVLRRLPYPAGNLVVEERIAVAQRPVRAPAHAVQRAA